MSYWGQTKPPLGSRIDWGNPLSAGLAGLWLLNENNGDTTTDLVSGIGLSVNSGGGWGETVDGGGLLCKATNSGAYNASPPASLKIPNAVSVMWRGVISSTSSLSYCPIVGMNAALTDTSPYYNYGLYYSSAGHFSVYGSGAGSAIQVSFVPNVGQIYTVVGTVSGTSASLYVSDSPVVTGGVVAIPSYGTSCNFQIGYYPGVTTRNTSGITTAAAVWNRVLSAAEVAALDTDPYSLIAPPVSRRVYFFGRKVVPYWLLGARAA